MSKPLTQWELAESLVHQAGIRLSSAMIAQLIKVLFKKTGGSKEQKKEERASKLFLANILLPSS